MNSELTTTGGEPEERETTAHLVAGLGFLFGCMAPAPIIKGFSVEMEPDEFAVALDGTGAPFYIQETETHWLLFPYDGQFVDTTLCKHVSKENLPGNRNVRRFIEHDTYLIEGQKFSGEFFRAFTPPPEGHCVEIRADDTGTIFMALVDVERLRSIEMAAAALVANVKSLDGYLPEFKALFNAVNGVQELSDINSLPGESGEALPG